MDLSPVSLPVALSDVIRAAAGAPRVWAFLAVVAYVRLVLWIDARRQARAAAARLLAPPSLPPAPDRPAAAEWSVDGWGG